MCILAVTSNCSVSFSKDRFLTGYLMFRPDFRLWMESQYVSRAEQQFWHNPLQFNSITKSCRVIFRGSVIIDGSVREKTCRHIELYDSTSWAYTDRSTKDNRIRGTPGVPGKFLLEETLHTQACCESKHLYFQLGNSANKRQIKKTLQLSNSRKDKDIKCLL